MTKEEIKMRIKASNEAVQKGLEPDSWVVEFRKKNNITKSKWKSKQPEKEKVVRTINSGTFKKGGVPHNKKTEEELEESKKRWSLNTKLWHQNNKERVNELARLRKENPSNRIKANLRKRLSSLLRLSLVKKTEQTMDLLGCSIEYFKEFLEGKFTDGMNFDNYGEWHLDHIVPCYHFDLTDEEQRKKCFHYTNFQPLWAKDNLIKNKRYEKA